MSMIGAIEAGGTKMVMATGDETGAIFDRREIPTTDPDQCIPQMISWFKEHHIDALGAAAFGPTGVNPASKRFGQILETPKTAWRYFDFRGALYEGLQVPIGYDTDVNAACLGEVVFGAAKQLDCVVYITVGTGIGAGVMIDGRLLHGMLHAEAGHILVTRAKGDAATSVCPYHQNCLEGVASGPAIEKRWGKTARELAHDDKVWELESSYLAQAISTYVLCYSPQRIILGGGVMHQTQLFPQIREKTLDLLAGYITTPELAAIDSYIVPASCGGDQGILGSIELGRRAL